VSDGTLEWMQWDETKGHSISAALAANSGWGLASSNQMSTLFSSFFGQSLWPIDDTMSYVFQLPFAQDDSDFIHFITLFGATAQTSNTDTINYLDIVSITRAIFGSGENDKGLYQEALVMDKGHSMRSGESYYSDAYAELTAAEYDNNDKDGFTGIALVRQASPAQVPEPSTIILLIVALLSLTINFQKHNQLV